MSNVGRPSKGVRDAITAKPPLPFGKILKKNATELGLTYGEYLVLLAAERLDMLEYAPTPTRDRSNEIVDFPDEGYKTTAA